jgi:hypothetical protein
VRATFTAGAIAAAFHLNKETLRVWRRRYELAPSSGGKWVRWTQAEAAIVNLLARLSRLQVEATDASTVTAYFKPIIEAAIDDVYRLGVVPQDGPIFVLPEIGQGTADRHQWRKFPSRAHFAADVNQHGMPAASIVVDVMNLVRSTSLALSRLDVAEINTSGTEPTSENGA